MSLLRNRSLPDRKVPPGSVPPIFYPNNVDYATGPSTDGVTTPACTGFVGWAAVSAKTPVVSSLNKLDAAAWLMGLLDLEHCMLPEELIRKRQAGRQAKLLLWEPASA